MKGKSKYAWIGGFMLTIISGLLIEYLKEFPIPGEIWGVILLFWKNFIALMTTPIKLYWIIVFLILVFLCLWIIPFREKKKDIKKTIKSNHTERKSKILNYTEELYHGILYKFSWHLSHNGWTLSGLTPCCPIDKTPLFDYRCPRCGKTFYNPSFHGDPYEENKLIILIQDNANKLLQKELQDP